MAVPRPYGGPEDLELMQRLAAECWRIAGPYASAHVGDPPWRMYQHLDKLTEVRVELWLDDGEAVAWGWLWANGELDALVHPERPELIDDVLGALEPRTVWALETDQDLVERIQRRGFRRHEGQWYEHMLRALDEPLPGPELPVGYSVRSVRGEQDVEQRVAVHRAAFAPSRVVPASYRQVMRAPPYRPELDIVAETRDGAFAAFCLCWYDEQNRVGELEPVGTHPDHRRRGLARAVCSAGLRGLQDAGAEQAVVYSVGGSDATRLYESIGFRSLARHIEFRKAGGKETEAAGVL